MNIIISGAGRGLGYEIVKLLSKDQDHHILAISRNKNNLKNLQEECFQSAACGTVSILPFDLAGDYREQDLTDGVKEYFDKIDILINNAGLLVNKPFREMDESDFDAVFNINVKAVFRLIRNLLPLFLRGSHIVNIGSMGGYQGSAKFPGLSLYSASKGALAILSECLAEELRKDQIKVNCLALGAAQTEMLAAAFPGYKAPLSAAEMAGFITDFALNGHRYFNGKILPVALSTP